MRGMGAMAGLGVAGLGLAAVFVACVALPLATYTLALACFGLAHVGSELRYLDLRFGARLGAAWAGRLAALLGLAAAARLLAMLGALPWGVALPAELGCVVLALLPLLRAGGPRRGPARGPGGGPARWLAAGLVAALLLGAALAPFLALLVLSVTHNLTPLGFLAERLRGAARRRALLWGGIGFVGLPLLIATGLPFGWLAAAGLVAPEAAVFPSAGGLTQNLGAYVPAFGLGSDWALPAFSASVFAQCMHYVAVLGVLPRLVPGAASALLRWPSPPRFALALAAAGAALLLGFVLDYGVARKVYALAALLHAWAELPVLLLALNLPCQAYQPSPAAVEQALASSAASSARRQGSGTSRRQAGASASTTSASTASTAGQ